MILSRTQLARSIVDVLVESCDRKQWDRLVLQIFEISIPLASANRPCRNSVVRGSNNHLHHRPVITIVRMVVWLPFPVMAGKPGIVSTTKNGHFNQKAAGLWLSSVGAGTWPCTIRVRLSCWSLSTFNFGSCGMQVVTSP